MTLDEALRVITEQTIPALSGGCGHVEALKIVVASLDVAAPTVRQTGSFDPGRWLDENVRRCAHGFIHISCGDCNSIGSR